MNTNVLYEYSAKIIPFIGLIGAIPFIFRNRDKCENDEDCPFIMKCCIIGFEKYCCSPNNYIKLEHAYNYITAPNK